MSYQNEKLEEFEQYITGRKVAIIGLGISNIGKRSNFNF